MQTSIVTLMMITLPLSDMSLQSGGHGVGWSEIPRYSFKVPAGWDETPVSIADLGGTEVRLGRKQERRKVHCAFSQVDLRYSSKEEGSLQVVVAPVLRFIDVGYNANVKIGVSLLCSAGMGPESLMQGMSYRSLYAVAISQDA
eukprot:1159638-Pelagomonas_calceolata.AAC.3